MNCSKANDYFMKYMDGCLSEEDAERLNKHLESCPACAEDFMAYDSIMKEFSETEMVEAPEGFEACVMAKIAELSPVHVKVNSSIDKILWFVMGAFSILLGLGFLLFVNRDFILEAMAAYPALAGYAQSLAPISEFVSEFITNVELTVTNAVTAASAFMGQFKYVVLAAAGVLFGVQFVLYRKDKVEE